MKINTKGNLIEKTYSKMHSSQYYKLRIKIHTKNPAYLLGSLLPVTYSKPDVEVHLC